MELAWTWTLWTKVLYLDLDEQPKVGKILEIKSLPCTVVLSHGQRMTYAWKI